MKKSIAFIVLAGGLLFVFLAFSRETNSFGDIPEEVNKVLETSCIGCHSTGARNEDAREALNFEKWEDYKLTKKIGLLDKIDEMVGEGKMPPAKFLERKPESKLSEKQKELVLHWAEKESTDLMEGN